MLFTEKTGRILEVTKCVLLTIIAGLLAGILGRTPLPYTYGNVQAGKLGQLEMPMVRVYGGSVEISNLPGGQP